MYTVPNTHIHFTRERESLHEKKKPIMQLNRISLAICHLVLCSSHFLLVCGCAVLLRTPMDFVFTCMHWTKLYVFLKYYKKNIERCSIKIHSKLNGLLSNLAFHCWETELFFNACFSVPVFTLHYRNPANLRGANIPSTHKKTTHFSVSSSPHLERFKATWLTKS